MSFSNFRGGQRSGNSDGPSRRTWRNRPSFRGSRTQKSYCSEEEPFIASTHQGYSNGGRPFFREDTRRQRANEVLPETVSHSNIYQNTSRSECDSWSYTDPERLVLSLDRIDCARTEQNRGVAPMHYSADVVKASFDTDLRFQNESRSAKPDGLTPWARNPYRLIDPKTSKLLDEALPILRSLKSSNPWQQSNNHSRPSNTQSMGVRNTQTSGQTPTHVAGNISHNEEHLNKSVISSANSTERRDLQSESFPSHSYFESLKQRAQGKALFGKSGPSLLQTPPRGFVWNNMQNQTSDAQPVFNSESAPSFGTLEEQKSPFSPTKNKGSPTTPVRIARNTWRDPQFQTDGGYMWRTNSASEAKLGDRASSPTANERATPKVNDDSERRLLRFNVPADFQERPSQSHYQGVQTVAKSSQVAYPKDDGNYPVVASDAAQSGTYSRASEIMFNMTHQDEEECPFPNVSSMKFQYDTCLGADVHEVEESRLLPEGVDVERLQYVLFFDINKKTFFDEVQKPFLPGSLLYFFYQDPSMLLPTREHPFYKENAHNWIYFYPDCGTEYGGYKLAAPAVITWMNEKVSQRVKFLVHGHQKQLKLDDMPRKVIYYPTSRVIDVVLLNRMLNGDFDAPRPGSSRTAAAGGTKTVAMWQNVQSASGDRTGGVTSVTSHRVLPGGATSRSTTAVTQSIRNCVSGNAATSPTKRSIANPRTTPARKKICWDR